MAGRRLGCKSNKTVNFLGEKIILKYFFSGKYIFIITSFK